MSQTNYDNNLELFRILSDALKTTGMTVIAGDTSCKVKINGRWYRISAEQTEVYEGDD